LEAVENAHTGWQETVNTDEFKQWAIEGGPTQDEADTLLEMQRRGNEDPTASAEAANLLNDYIRKYPHWWANKGSLIQSPEPHDAIKLLDAFKARNETASEFSETTAESRSNQRRLERAVTPTRGGGAPARRQSTDQEDFEAEFNR